MVSDKKQNILPFDIDELICYIIEGYLNSKEVKDFMEMRGIEEW